MAHEDWSDALQRLHALKEADPAEALVQVQHALRGCGEFTAAWVAAELQLVRGWVLETQGDWQNALDATHRALRLLTPAEDVQRLAAAHLRLASIQSQIGAHQDALKSIESASDLLAQSPEASLRDRLRYMGIRVLDSVGRWSDALALAHNMPTTSPPAHQFSVNYAMANACLRREDIDGTTYWLARSKDFATTLQQQACQASAQMSLHSLQGDAEAAAALMADAQLRFVAFPAIVDQMRVLQAKLFLRLQQTADAEACLASVSDAETLTLEERAAYWDAKAGVSGALGHAQEQQSHLQRKAQCLAESQQILSHYQVKAIQASLAQLDAQLLLADSLKEVHQLQAAIRHREAELEALGHVRAAAPSLLAELMLEVNKAHLRRPDGVLDLSRLGFSLHFQASRTLTDHVFCGAEALLRLQHPHLGHLLPAETLPRLERSGDMVEVTKWVLAEVCTVSKQRSAQGHAPVSLSLNLSASVLSSPEWISFACDHLHACGLQPLSIVLEVSEAMAVHEDPRIREALSQLKASGFALCIDDYGIGYCNFARLIDLAPHSVKIDRSLIRNLLQGTPSLSALNSLIQSSHAMDLWVTAVGVETPHQAEVLGELGCDAAQGYWVKAHSQPPPL